MQRLALKIKECRECDLYKEAQKAVPGSGNIDADIIFIGEAPGAREMLPDTFRWESGKVTRFPPI